MKKNQILLFFTLSLFSYLSNAQTGYLGRNLLLKYNLHTGPAIASPTLSKPTTPVDFDEIGLNLINEIDLEYVYSRNSSVSMTLGFTKTIVPHQILGKVGETENTNYSSINAYDFETGEYIDYKYLFDEKNLPTELYSYSLGIKHTKYFKKYSGIAPLGLYGAWSFHILRNTGKIKNISEEVQEVLKTQEEDYSVSNTTIAIGYELGRQQVYYDRFVLNIALSLKYVYSSTLFDIEYDYSGGYDESYAQDEEWRSQENRLKRNMSRRLTLQQLINVKFGIAYLIK
ncbi:MAG: hypothetical protein GY827_09905 [Cytophagales bacterium]|nr:hypothetical protein [Cytophagales bacterium]